MTTANHSPGLPHPDETETPLGTITLAYADGSVYETALVHTGSSSPCLASVSLNNGREVHVFVDADGEITVETNQAAVLEWPAEDDTPTLLWRPKDEEVTS